MTQTANTEFRPGEVWRDTDGKPIQAHGGGVLFADGTYYWYGENKDAETVNKKVPFTGFGCYASTDLLNWRNLGIVLAPVPDDPNHDLHPDNLRDSRYVWLPLELAGGQPGIAWHERWHL